MGEPMRILYFVNTTNFGGVERHILDILNTLDERRFSSRLLCPEPLAVSLSPKLKDPSALVALPVCSFENPSSVRAFAREVRAFSPQIVHSHLYNATRFAVPLCKLLRVPTLVETGHLVESWRTGTSKLFTLGDIVLSKFVDKVIAVSNAVKDYYVTYKKVPKGKIEVIHNWCDQSVFSAGRFGPEEKARIREQEGFAPADKIVGVVGRLEMQKGHEYLIDALPKIVARCPDVVVLAVGDGVLRADLEERARRLGVSKSIRFVGFRTDVAELMSIMDLLALPSLFEGMPLTLIEAAAMGIPAVATRVDGSGDVLVDGGTGYLVPPKDPQQMADKICDLLGQDELRAKMSVAGVERARTHFDQQIQIGKLEDLYERVAR